MYVKFFLELWEQLQAGPQASDRGDITGGVSFEDVMERTSSAAGLSQEDGALFDEMIAVYSLRRRTAQEYLVSALVDSHAKAFRGYTSRVQFTTIGDSAVLGK
jgi:RAD50-interacting protein 1